MTDTAQRRMTEAHIRKQDASDLVDEYHKFEDKIDLLEDENRLKDEKIREYLELIDKLQSMLKEITLNLNRLEADMIDDGWDNEYVMIACKRIRSICYEGLRGYSDD